MTNMQNIMNETLNPMTAKIAQRCKLLNANPDATFEEKLIAALTENRSLTQEELATEMQYVQHLATVAEGNVQKMAEDGVEEMEASLSAMTREECLGELSKVLNLIHQWDREREHDDLSLSEEAYDQLTAVYDSFAKNENPDLTKQEIIDLTIELTRQYTMIQIAESMEYTVSNICKDDENELVSAEDSELHIPQTEIEERALKVAVAYNLKKTGKLPKVLASMSDEVLATMVCGMDAVNGYCAKAAACKLNLSTLAKVAFNILAGLLTLFVGAYGMLLGGVLQVIGVIEFCCGIACLVSAVHDFWTALFPAGLSETRPVVAIKRGVQALASTAARIISSAVRKITEMIGALVNTVLNKGREVVQNAANTVKNAAEAELMRTHVIF